MTKVAFSYSRHWSGGCYGRGETYGEALANLREASIADSLTDPQAIMLDWEAPNHRAGTYPQALVVRLGLGDSWANLRGTCKAFVPQYHAPSLVASFHWDTKLRGWYWNVTDGKVEHGSIVRFPTLREACQDASGMVPQALGETYSLKITRALWAGARGLALNLDHVRLVDAERD